MKYPILGFTLFLCITSCDRRGPSEVTSTETRPPSTSDGKFVLDATSEQRFSGASAEQKAPVSSFSDVAPDAWRPMESSAFRIKNYQFGTAGEVYLSVSSGAVLDNVNRWLGQFNQPNINASALAQLPTVDFLGTKAYWIQADGTFAGGMGKAQADNYSLRGVMAEVNGAIVTVKMIGPTSEVKEQEEALRSYVGTVKSGD